ncbi:TetR/AcrR family transcriptional regulator [Streptomyces sp. NPDC092296]|uniref:TetR/AcrR family transcriptional regulator n=1 Tax=Streptomyces sp. NPDC092296 TaxID=3366012 RepID=UPI003813DFFD
MTPSTQPPGNPAPTGRRERNKQRVKERLYQSALSLFAEQGYEHTSIDEIAERADVARGTFFNYFQRKEDLIAAWGDQRRERLQQGIRESMNTENIETAAYLDRCMTVLSALNNEEREVTRAMLVAWVKTGRPILEEPYAAEIFAEAVRTGLSRGDLAADADPERVGNLLRDAYLGTLYRWVRQPNDHFQLYMELRAVVSIVLNGITRRPPA